MDPVLSKSPVGDTKIPDPARINDDQESMNALNTNQTKLNIF